MILLLGGTTEGRRAVDVLDEAGTPYYYSTRGTGQIINSAYARHITGGMNSMQLASFCQEHDIRLIIDAAHPFATQLHTNIDIASRMNSLPVIRFERKYPPLSDGIVICSDWSDAINKLQGHRLLALTGVETIAKLRPYWKQHETWFRILDRKSSWSIVDSESFPHDHILITSTEHSATIPDLPFTAIITKESGESGWFDAKVELAKKYDVPLFVVKRPELPLWPTVTGPHGLRRAVEHCLPSFYPLHTGLTTGSCATAAAVAALRCLLSPDLASSPSVTIELPDGEEVSLPLSECHSGYAAVVKDGGSDPDATHGCIIEARVEITDDTDIEILGGEGVGRITLPGLDFPPGEAAINRVPREMIRNNIRKIFKGGLRVTISVPEGVEIARKTFNSRLGIVDGISIIGTSGVVRPFSNEAFVEAMKRQMLVAQSLACPIVVLNSGLRSEQAVRQHFPDLHSAAYIHYGNLIGDALTAAAQLHITHVALCVMIGKAVKLAAGNLNTHSHQVTMDRCLLTQWLTSICPEQAVEIAQNINMARELPEILSPDLWKKLKETIIEKCISTCKKVYPYTLDFYLLD